MFLGEVTSQVPLIDAALLKCYEGAPWLIAEALEIEYSMTRTMWLLPLTPETTSTIKVI